MNALILILLVNAAPHGLQAESPQSLVTQASALLPQWSEGKNRAPYDATSRELKEWLKGLGVKAKDLDSMTRRSVAELKAPSEVQPFVAERALVRVHMPQIDVSFSRGATAASVSFLSVGTNTFVVLSPPTPDKVRTPEPNGEEQLFELRNGAWVEAAIPKAKEPGCAETLKRAANELYVAEKSYFAEYDTFESNLAKIGFVPPEGVTIKTLQANAQGFRAEIALKGASFRIDDAKNMTFVGECKE